METTASVLAVLATVLVVLAVLAARVILMAAPPPPALATAIPALTTQPTALPNTPGAATLVAATTIPATDAPVASEPTQLNSPEPLATATAPVLAATEAATVLAVVTSTLPPSATLAATLAATATPPPPATATVVIPTEPPPTAVPSATLPVAPLSIIHDRACLQTPNNRLYIFGEIDNQGAETYDIYNLRARILGASGELNAPNQWFDLPGDYFVAPGTRLPFVLIAQLEQPDFSTYEVDLTFEPSTRSLRSDLTIEEVTTTPSDDQIELTGRWAHAGPSPSQFVSIVATAYDGEGRVANMSYVYLTNMTPLTPGLPEGQHQFDLYLPPSPCGDGTIAVSILGE